MPTNEAQSHVVVRAWGGSEIGRARARYEEQGATTPTTGEQRATNRSVGARILITHLLPIYIGLRWEI